ncbi:hypothetical protein Tco_1294246 [Tanacetum coccineum]
MSSSSLHATVTYTFAPLSPVLFLEYSEYLASSDDEVPAEDQPLPVDASLTADLLGYIANSEPIEDEFEEDPEMDPVDHVVDEEEESSNDDKEKEEHPTPADSALPVPDSTGLCRSQKTVRPHTHLSSFIEAQIVEYASAPSPPLPPSSPLTPLSSPLPRIPSPPLLLPPTRPLHTSLTYAQIPSPPLPLPSPDCRDAIPEADMPPWKRTCFTALSHRFEIGESSAAAR